MRRLDAYQQASPNWTRVEMLLAAFDGVIQRLQDAQEHLANNDSLNAQALLLRAQRIVLELYSGLDLRHGTVPENMAKLYLFVLHCIGFGDSLNLPAALNVLSIIRNGLEGIRGTANDLERQGHVPHIPLQTQVLSSVVG